MSDLLIQATISNLLVSTLLAGIAWTVQLRVRSASLVNLLWVIVLVKLVTPPMFLIPAIEISKSSYSGNDQTRGSGVEPPVVSMPADTKVSTVGMASVSIVSMRSDRMNWALAAWIWTSFEALKDWHMNVYHKHAKAWAVKSGAIMENIIANFELTSTRLIRVCPCCGKTTDEAYPLNQEQKVLAQPCTQCGFHFPTMPETADSTAVFQDIA